MPEFSSLRGKLAPLASLRNLLAHEYLEIRFERIRKFLDDGVDTIKALSESTSP